MTLKFPRIGLYAVVRIDPVAMVEHLNDPIALQQARALLTKKYLVYLKDVRMPHGISCASSS